MKNKYIKLGCLILGAAFAFASCGDDGEHTHTFSDAWATNATHHWHAATCGHGEQKKDNAEHVDQDQDGVCDVCAYEVGHEHTYSQDWAYDAEDHWHPATCVHTTEQGDKDKHADEAPQDGECDVCGGHVHVINTYGFCNGCDLDPGKVDEDTLGSVVYATFARKKFVVGGNIDYKFTGENKTDKTTNTMEHTVDYELGTNGTYLKRSYTNSTNQSEVQEDFIKALPNGSATGITVISVNKEVTQAQPSTFTGDSLLGYYYAVSTLADGHGAENVLKSLYEASQNTEAVVGGADGVTVDHDKANKKYSFKYNTLITQELDINIRDPQTGETTQETMYNGNYFEVEVDFTYNEQYSLTSLNIKCDCYTTDAGAGYEADIDFTYDPTNGMVWKENPGVDNYTITVTQQTAETREEITLQDASLYAPESFELQGATNEKLNLEVGEDTTLKLIGSPAGKYMSFIKNDLVVSITDKNGATTVKGLSAILHGYDELNIYPRVPGEYIVTLTYGKTVETVNITVTGLPLGGAEKFEYTSTNNNAWDQTYSFKAEKNGVYTFYIPYGASVAKYTKTEQDGSPYIEDKNIFFDYDNNHPMYGIKEGEATFTVSLTVGETIKFCFRFRDSNMTYTFGYDKP